MQIFFITLTVLLLCVVGMALGVIFSNKPLKGSCGGLNRIMGLGCMFCTKEDKEACRKKASL